MNRTHFTNDCKHEIATGAFSILMDEAGALFVEPRRRALRLLCAYLTTAAPGDWLLCTRGYLRRFDARSTAKAALASAAELFARVGITMRVVDHDHAAGRAREMRLFLPPKLLALHEAIDSGVFAGDHPIDLFTGRPVTRRIRRRAALRKKAEIVEELRDADPVVAERIGHYLRQPGLLGLIHRHIEDAVEVAKSLSTGKRQQSLRVLAELRASPYYLPRPARKGQSHRITDKDSVSALPRKVRMVLLPSCLGLDLVACHPTVMTRLLGADVAREHFQRCKESGEDPWFDVCRSLLPSDSAHHPMELRGAVKILVTSMLCGQSDRKSSAVAWQTIGRPFGIDAPFERLVAHPVIGDLVRGYRRLKGALYADGFVDTCYGRVSAPRAPGTADADHEHAVRGALSCFVDGIEARVMNRVLAVVSQWSGVRPVADTHDGVLLHFRDLRCTHKVQSVLDAITRELDRFGAELGGVPLRIRVDYDPRLTVAQRREKQAHTQLDKMDAAVDRLLHP